MLFLPPRPPVRLAVGQHCVMGRSPNCELPIPSVGASRRHAHVTWESQGIMIRDLDSTNGTFVNGAKLTGPHRLAPGDRIMIGDRTVTFCHVDPALATQHDAPGDVDTVQFASPHGAGDGSAFTGNLTEIPAFAVVQMLELGMKTGLLEIQRGEDSQRIWFHCGMPFHAVAGVKNGIEAAFDIVLPVDGRFVFHPDTPYPTRTIQRSVTEILLEASRRLDESKR
jgi:pSer/pThr/pTyr-binding forkhead associated (FHA) protein